MKGLVFSYVLLTTNMSFATGEWLIEDPGSVTQLISIQQSLDNVSSSIMLCIDSGKDHSSCLCEGKEAITQFNTRVNTLLSENQNLAEHDLVRFKSNDGFWVTQSIQGLLKQASTGTPECD
ncbi:MAG: hypothetical protein HOK54_22640 [Alphaproteobacteria bacterium]|jgi:hypothetical protein|nr:hypothetical protein [Alphaproteobacteria bacterium]